MVFIMFCGFVQLLEPQLLFPENSANAQPKQSQKIVFWNVENAFWPEDDDTKQDDDFTPTGMRHWSKSRLKQKLTQAEKVLLGIGQGLPPLAVGLAEVEGDSVINYWLHKTSLYRLNYRAVLSDSADRRGIQTALLYQPADFRLISHESHSITLPDGNHSTRQLLHVAGRLVSSDTLDLIVCHLPSQYGGARQSESLREAAHVAVMHLADSISAIRQTPYVVIMGDMNEAPSKRHDWWRKYSTLRWSNLMLPLQHSLKRKPAQYGSHKYQGKWSFLDQFIVSENFLLTDKTSPDEYTSNVQTMARRLQLNNPRSFSMPFMLTDDETHLGKRPKRSFFGSQYEGGLSDHLPIVVDLDVYF